MIIILSQLPPIPIVESPGTCIQNTGQAIAFAVITLGGVSGALTVAIKGFFDVEKTRLVAELQGELKRLENENKHLSSDMEDEKIKNRELYEENENLKSSGFTSQLLILENRLAASEKRNDELIKKLSQAVNIIKNNKAKNNE